MLDDEKRDAARRRGSGGGGGLCRTAGEFERNTGREYICGSTSRPGRRTRPCPGPRRGRGLRRPGKSSKNYYSAPWDDAAGPASRSRLWPGRSPACTRLSPTRENTHTHTPEGTSKHTHTHAVHYFSAGRFVWKKCTSWMLFACISSPIFTFPSFSLPESSPSPAATQLRRYYVFVNSAI